jgi:hypothetical protein
MWKWRLVRAFGILALRDSEDPRSSQRAIGRGEGNSVKLDVHRLGMSLVSKHLAWNGARQ